MGAVILMQDDLLAWEAPYRDGLPGFKRHGTSEAAAKSVAPTVKDAHQAILDALTAYGPMTADQLAKVLGRDILYIRPRCSEMRKEGLIFDTGKTAPNASGKMAEVLTA